MSRFVALALVANLVIWVGCQNKEPSRSATSSDTQTETANVSTSDQNPASANQQAQQDTVAVAKDEEDIAADERAENPAEQSRPSEEEPLAEDGSEAEPEDLLDTLPMDVNEPSDLIVSAWLPAHRMFLPTTAGPLIVDAEIRLGDELLANVFERRIEDVIQAADDGEAGPTWNKLFSHVMDNPEQFGGQPGFNRGQYRQMIERFDRNRNKRPDFDEVPRFLFRNSGIDVPFRLTGTDHYREINRSGSALFAAIDSNGDRALDEAEVSAAPQALLRFDPNADQRIDPVEVISVVLNDPAWDRRKSNRRGEVATDLDGYVDWTMVSYSIESMTGNAPFATAQNSIDQLDQDNDASISAAEAKELLDIVADIRLKVTFGSESSGEAEIEVVWLRPELKSLNITQHASASVTVSDDSFNLLLVARDGPAGRNRIPREAFEMLDANNDGALEEDEIPDAAANEFSIDNLDTDDDGKLTFEEINSAQPGPQPIWNAQVRARGAEFPDGIFAWLDANHDQFLSTREILNSEARLRQCSPPGQAIKPIAIPDTFAIQFMHADPLQDQQNFQFSSIPQVPSGDWPRWAQNMDVNRDGEISELEFPGSASQFQKLDSNGDGFISADEITD